MTTTVNDKSAIGDSAKTAATKDPPTGRRHGRGRRFLYGLRTFVVALVLFGTAAAGGTYLVQHRLAARGNLSLGTAVLTADPVPVGSPQAAMVNAIQVREQSRVSAGEVLAVVRLTTPVPTGSTSAGQQEAAPQSLSLRAPVSGTVSAVNVKVGGVAQPGQPVVTLYNQSALTFQASCDADTLRRLRLGMTAYVDGPGLAHRIPTRLSRVRPQVGGSGAAADRLTVVLVPQRSALSTVSTLVPGLPYTATVDTTTATGGTPAVNSAG